MTYSTLEPPEQILQSLLNDLPKFFETAHACSLRAIKNYCPQILREFPTQFASAQLVSLILSLSDEVPHRDTSHFKVLAADKHIFTDGLSPIFNIESQAANFAAFVRQLNDRSFLSKVYGPAEDDVLTIAISYKHEQHRTKKLSRAHLDEIAAAVPTLAQELGLKHVQIWIDRILSSKQRPDDRSWWKRGLAPFLQLPVLYVSGEDRSDAALTAEMNTMWINIERVAACIGRGMVSYGRRFDRNGLARHGIAFSNARASCFDWWIHDGVEGDVETQFRTLLFAMGNTKMLERETYFEEDRLHLLREAREVFRDEKVVANLRPVNNYVMRDSISRRSRRHMTWLGALEWCINFMEVDVVRGARSIKDAIAAVEETVRTVFCSYQIEDKNGDATTWVVVCPERIEPTVALALQLNGEERDAVGLRATIVIDSPLEFLELSKNPVMGAESVERNVPEVAEMLRRSGVLEDAETLLAVAPLRSDEAVCTKALR